MVPANLPGIRWARGCPVTLAAQAQRISLQNILFTTDFSPTAEAALPYALAIARCYGSKIFVAHCVRPGAIVGIPMEPAAVDLNFNWQDAQSKMAEFVRRNPLDDFDHQTILRQGQLWDVLSATIQTHDISLIVLGTHGRSGIKKMFLGSEAEQILRLATCPVLTVGPQAARRPAEVKNWKRILFATDFSAGSLHALPYALSLAEENQATLILLHMIPMAPLGEEQDVINATRQHLRAMVPKDAEPWCEVEIEVEIGFPSDGILHIAERQEADLIVMGVHAASSPRASAHLPWAIGHEVVSRANCPVLTVRG
jgi:nucleotide-binding universal stress UspA family protein